MPLKPGLLRKGDILLTQEVKQMQLGALKNRRLTHAKIYGVSDEAEAFIKSALSEKGNSSVRDLFPDGLEIGGTKYPLDHTVYLSRSYFMAWYVMNEEQDRLRLVAIGLNRQKRKKDFACYKIKYPSLPLTSKEYMLADVMPSFLNGKAVYVFHSKNCKEE